MTKIGYVTIGAKDSEASVKFYDAVFKALGDERKFSEGGWTGYGAPSEDKGFTGCHTMLCKPHNGKEAARRQRHHDFLYGAERRTR